MKFILQGEYTTLNSYSTAERTHYRYGASIKKAETNRAALELKQQWDGVPIPKSVFKFTWYRLNRRTDPDNICAFGRKVILDGMQQAGIIPNDGWKQVAGFIDCFEVDKNNPRVEIETIDDNIITVEKIIPVRRVGKYLVTAYHEGEE